MSARGSIRLIFADHGPDDECPWRFDAVTSPDDWKVLKMRLTRQSGPAASSAEAGLTVVPDIGNSEILLQAAAKLASPCLTIPNRERLFDSLKVQFKGRKPKAENALLAALIQHILPAPGAEDIHSYIANRSSKDIEDAGPTDLSNPEVLEAIRHIADESDIGDIQKYASAHSAASSSRSGGHALPHHSTPSSSSSLVPNIVQMSEVTTDANMSLDRLRISFATGTRVLSLPRAVAPSVEGVLYSGSLAPLPLRTAECVTETLLVRFSRLHSAALPGHGAGTSQPLARNAPSTWGSLQSQSPDNDLCAAASKGWKGVQGRRSSSSSRSISNNSIRKPWGRECGQQGVQNKLKHIFVQAWCELPKAHHIKMFAAVCLNVCGSMCQVLCT